MLSYPTSTLSQLGQPVWYRYNSQSGRSVPHEYNNISAGLGWPVWIGFLSTWVVRMVLVNSIERCEKLALCYPNSNSDLPVLLSKACPSNRRGGHQSNEHGCCSVALLLLPR